MTAAPTGPEKGGPGHAPKLPTQIPGLLLCVLLSLPAAWLGSRFPLVGGPVFGILFGLLVGSTGLIHQRFRPGIVFSSKQMLQAAVVLLGAGLSLIHIVKTGAGSLLIMLSTLTACLLVAWGLGRLLGIRRNLVTLIGVGTGICGGSAIAAVSSIIDAEERDVAYAISTIFAFNAAAVLMFPAFGHLANMGQESFGMLAGLAINDTSSVVAAGYVYGEVAGAYATVVKLTRTTLIVPVALGIAGLQLMRIRREALAEAAVGSDGPVTRVRVWRLIPWFVVWFLMVALLNTVGVIPPAVSGLAVQAAKLLIVVALTAVGLSANPRQMAQTGWKPLLLGGCLWIVVTVTALTGMHLSGYLG